MPGILGLLHGGSPRRTAASGSSRRSRPRSACSASTRTRSTTITQITLASNTGTFLVYGFTCLIAIVALRHRHDKHIFKHYVVPGDRGVDEPRELLGVVYLAVQAGGDSASDAYKALGDRRRSGSCSAASGSS